MLRNTQIAGQNTGASAASWLPFRRDRCPFLASEQAEMCLLALPPRNQALEPDLGVSSVGGLSPFKNKNQNKWFL